MTSRGPFLFLVVVLMGLGIASAAFRLQNYHIPVLPGEQQRVWQVEAKLRFRANGGPAQAVLTLPPQQSGFRFLDENAASSGYGFIIESQDGQRRARWSRQQTRGVQTLYYKLELVEDPDYRVVPPSPETPIQPNWDEPYRTAAAHVLETTRPIAADALTLTQQLIAHVSASPMDQNVALLLDAYTLPDLLVDMLAESSVPARKVQALKLEDGRRRQSLVELMEVWQGGEWHLFDPRRGLVQKRRNLLLWQTGTPSLIEVQGGTRSRVSFSMISQIRPSLDIANQEARPLLSLYSLPIEEQSMFKLIMLLPIGALVVVFMRLLVGLKTSGTFMPVLIAMAFLQTQLLPGLISFLLIIALGLLIRSFLSALNLLLVARIAILIIIVISIISISSVISYRLGLIEGLTITFFPMIILAWTIERMSIIWEEEGPREVLIQGSGSLIVAVAAFLLMDQPLTRHLVFNFPEIHLCVLALILLMGRYTGYRLFELKRFEAMDTD